MYILRLYATNKTTWLYRFSGYLLYFKKNYKKKKITNRCHWSRWIYLLSLLEKIVVHGIKRRTSLINTGRIDHIYEEPLEKNFLLDYGDVIDVES